MLGLIVVVFAGCMINKLWKGGVLFMVIWPVVAMAIQIPMTAQSRATFGETLEITPAFLFLSYLQTLVLTAIIFMAAYGIRRLFKRRPVESSDSETLIAPDQ